MTAAESLAGYAGGDAVVTAAAKVKDADSEAITAAATRLTTAAANASTYGGQVAGGVTGLDEAWQGSSADNFVAYMSRFAKAGTDIGTAMTNAAGALNDVAGAITGAKSYVATRCEQALTEITNWRRDHPDASQQELDAMTRGVCAETASDINTHLEGTETVLSSALATVNAGKSPASRFSTLPQPDTQPFTPQHGQQVEWIETPPPETKPAATTPASTSQQPSTATNPGTSAGGNDGGNNGGGNNGGGGGGMGPSGGPPVGGPPPGNVQEWINQAIEILRQNGINVTEADAQRIWQIIQHESGGNPHAINNWDSNAAKGTPSKGLMQCIDPTFNSYKLPGHNDIWNPVDNICAGVNYALSRYGSLANVPGIKATESGGGYVGY